MSLVKVPLSLKTVRQRSLQTISHVVNRLGRTPRSIARLSARLSGADETSSDENDGGLHTFWCCICRERHSMTSEITLVLTNCGHTFCRESIRSWVAAQVNNGSAYPTCAFVHEERNPRRLLQLPPHGPCKSLLAEADIITLLGGESSAVQVSQSDNAARLMIAYTRLLTSRARPNERECHECGERQQGRADNPIMCCAKCGAEYCFFHASAHKSDKTCAQFEAEKAATWAPDIELVSKLCKPCPGCRVPIEKVEGCNSMRCSRCGTSFCWLCLRQLRRSAETGGEGSAGAGHVAGDDEIDHYSFWNVSGCPLKQHAKPATPGGLFSPESMVLNAVYGLVILVLSPVGLVLGLVSLLRFLLLPDTSASSQTAPVVSMPVTTTAAGDTTVAATTAVLSASADECSTDSAESGSETSLRSLRLFPRQATARALGLFKRSWLRVRNEVTGRLSGGQRMISTLRPTSKHSPFAPGQPLFLWSASARGKRTPVVRRRLAKLFVGDVGDVNEFGAGADGKGCNAAGDVEDSTLDKAHKVLDVNDPVLGNNGSERIPLTDEGNTLPVGCKSNSLEALQFSGESDGSLSETEKSSRSSGAIPSVLPPAITYGLTPVSSPAASSIGGWAPTPVAQLPAPWAQLQSMTPAAIRLSARRYGGLLQRTAVERATIARRRISRYGELLATSAAGVRESFAHVRQRYLKLDRRVSAHMTALRGAPSFLFRRTLLATLNHLRGLSSQSATARDPLTRSVGNVSRGIMELARALKPQVSADLLQGGKKQSGKIDTAMTASGKIVKQQLTSIPHTGSDSSGRRRWMRGLAAPQPATAIHAVAEVTLGRALEADQSSPASTPIVPVSASSPVSTFIMCLLGVPLLAVLFPVYVFAVCGGGGWLLSPGASTPLCGPLTASAATVANVVVPLASPPASPKRSRHEKAS